MWLKNARIFVCELLSDSSSPLGTTEMFNLWKGENVSPKFITGETLSDLERSDGTSYMSIYERSIYSLTSSFASSANIESQGSSETGMYGVAFGTGSVPPTEDDYCFSGERISGLTSSNVSLARTIEVNASGFSYTTEYTISNTLGNDITIREIGLISCVSGKFTIATSSRYKSALIERTVLDSPVTIPAGGVGKVTYTIRINNFTTT